MDKNPWLITKRGSYVATLFASLVEMLKFATLVYMVSGKHRNHPPRF